MNLQQNDSKRNCDTFLAACSLIIVGGNCLWSPANTAFGALSKAAHVATSVAYNNQNILI